jgi:hypothetical protein
MPTVNCPKCKTVRVKIDDGIHCLAKKCGEHTPAREAALHVAGNHGMDEWSHVKDGGPSPLSKCPNCESEVFVDLAWEGESSVCLGCGEKYEAGDIQQCDGCGQPMEKSDMSICPGCWDEKMGKD